MKNGGKISVIGLGKLGACLAATLAYKGFDVLGLDINKKVVDLTNKGKAPVIEPRLQEIMDKKKGKLAGTVDFKKIVKHSDISFIIVPTPSTKDGSFSEAFLKDVLWNLAKHIKDKKGHYTIVINSTVTPTTIEKSLIPFIEKETGKKVNKEWSICYNPEFIALGNVVKGILEPDVVLVGESNKNVGDRLERIYKKLCDNNPPIARMSLVSAEIAKISLNAFVTMKISFANTLGQICERIPGADVDVISRALGADKRISPYFIKSGLPFGGPCFPRDNRAFNAFAKKVGVEAPLAKATDKINNLHTENLFKKINEIKKRFKHDSLSILGLAYKIQTDIIEESAVIKIINMLLNQYKEIKIFVYDPLAMDNVKKLFDNRISYSQSAKECLDRSPFWIIASPEVEFKNINALDVKHPTTAIIDCWRILNPLDFDGKASYFSLGGNFYERH